MPSHPVSSVCNTAVASAGNHRWPAHFRNIDVLSKEKSDLTTGSMIAMESPISCLLCHRQIREGRNQCGHNSLSSWNEVVDRRKVVGEHS